MSEYTHRLVYLDGTRVERVDCKDPVAGDYGLTVQVRVVLNQLNETHKWVGLVVYYPHVYSIKEIAR